jgi:hypothetical protein
MDLSLGSCGSPDGVAEVGLGEEGAVTPQVFSSIIALHYMSISMHHFMLIHVVATNVICFEVLFDSHHVTLGSWCN